MNFFSSLFKTSKIISKEDNISENNISDENKSKNEENNEDTNNKLYSVNVCKLTVKKRMEEQIMIRENLFEKKEIFSKDCSLSTNNISSTTFTYEQNMNTCDCKLLIDLGTFYSNGFIFKKKPTSIKIKLNTNEYKFKFVFSDDSLTIKYFSPDNGSGIKYTPKKMISQIYLGNKVDTSKFKNKSQSWVITNSPNCIAFPLNGGFDKPDFIENLCSSSILEEKPYEFSKNIAFYHLQKDQIWLYYSKLNSNHECLESICTMKDNQFNKVISNAIKISNKIIKNIDDLQINHENTPKQILDLVSISDTKKWIDSLMIIIVRLNIYNSKLYQTTNYLKRITN